MTVYDKGSGVSDLGEGCDRSHPSFTHFGRAWCKGLQVRCSKMPFSRMLPRFGLVKRHEYILTGVDSIFICIASQRALFLCILDTIACEANAITFKHFGALDFP